MYFIKYDFNSILFLHHLVPCDLTLRHMSFEHLTLTTLLYIVVISARVGDSSTSNPYRPLRKYTVLFNMYANSQEHT